MSGIEQVRGRLSVGEAGRERLGGRCRDELRRGEVGGRCREAEMHTGMRVANFAIQVTWESFWTILYNMSGIEQVRGRKQQEGGTRERVGGSRWEEHCGRE